MSTTLETMLDNDIPVDEQGPGGLPEGEVVFQVCAVDVSELWRNLSESCRKSGIVISQIPNLQSLGGRSGNFAQALLTDFEFFLNRWAIFPVNGGVPANGTPVDSVPVTNNRDWVDPLAELDKRAMGS
jgi:hypothetical protein